jgi:rhamnulose-1-phosphate aldolase
MGKMASKNKYKDFLKSSYIREISDAALNMWRAGWAERNAGNISYLLEENIAKKYFNINKFKKNISLSVIVKELAGCIFIVTGTGKYFKNIKGDPSNNLGVVKVSKDGESIGVIWGFDDGNGPTSELVSHFLSHIERLKADPLHRVIIHTHATNVIAMTAVHDLDEKAFTKTLWKMCSECIVVFPDGVGVIPWMVRGLMISASIPLKK